MEEMERKISTWNIQVPTLLDKAIEEAIDKDFHVTKAEFIRDAVRQKLEKMGITANSKEVKAHVDR